MLMQGMFPKVDLQLPPGHDAGAGLGAGPSAAHHGADHGPAGHGHVASHAAAAHDVADLQVPIVPVDGSAAGDASRAGASGAHVEDDPDELKVKLGKSIEDKRRVDCLLRQVEIDLNERMQKKLDLQRQREQLEAQENVIEARLVLQLMRHRNGDTSQSLNKVFTKRARCGNQECTNNNIVVETKVQQEPGCEPLINIDISGATWIQPDEGAVGLQGAGQEERGEI